MLRTGKESVEKNWFHRRLQNSFFDADTKGTIWRPYFMASLHSVTVSVAGMLNIRTRLAQSNFRNDISGVRTSTTKISCWMWLETERKMLDIKPYHQILLEIYMQCNFAAHDNVSGAIANNIEEELQSAFGRQISRGCKFRRLAVIIRRTTRILANGNSNRAHTMQFQRSRQARADQPA